MGHHLWISGIEMGSKLWISGILMGSKLWISGILMATDFLFTWYGDGPINESAALTPPSKIFERTPPPGGGSAYKKICTSRNILQCHPTYQPMI